LARGTELAPLIGPLEQALRRRRLTVAVAESCTGGLLCAALTDMPGASDYFVGGLVTYADGAKLHLLGVSEAVLQRQGAVSREVARLMAKGARSVFQTDVAIAVTGVAGPTSEGKKPVGLTFVAVVFRDRMEVRRYRGTGGRASNRVASVEAALQLATAVVRVTRQR